jgi:hypothetical protein
MIATLSLAEMRRRWSSFGASLAGKSVPPERGSGFWFDPAYAAFLEAVRRQTPVDATIAIIVPARPDLYVYEAAYQLAPRRIVTAGSGQEGEARFVAAYRYQYREVRNSVVLQIPGGALFRRQ